MLKRLREPSSWAALAAVAAIVRPELAPLVPMLGEAVALGAGAVAATIAVLTPEKGR